MSVEALRVLVDFNETSNTTNLFFDDTVLGLFNTGTFADGNEGIDIADYVRTGQITRGATGVDGPIVRYDAGRLTLTLDNRDRRFDPTYTTGPYSAGGVSQVTPMRKIQVSGLVPHPDTPGTLLPVMLFTGFADAWHLDYPSSGHDATVTLTATDATKIFAAFDGPEQSSQGAGETVEARLERIITHVGFPVDSVGNPLLGEDPDAQAATPCQATTLAANAWTEMLLAVDTEMGDLLITTDGFPHVYGRNRPYTATTLSTPFGDAAGELPFADVSIGLDDQQLYNKISIARTGGTAKTADNTVSQDQYLVHTFTRTDLIHQTDAESQLYADYVLALSKDPHLRIRDVTLNAMHPQSGVALRSLAMKITDKIDVNFTVPGSTARVSRTAIIRGVDHTFSPGKYWTTRWTLEDAERYAGFVFNSTSNGVLDTNWFAY